MLLPSCLTTYEKGVIQGEIKGKRAILRLQLTKRFGPLSVEVVHRLEAWPPERLDELVLAILDAESLETLGLKA